ncbi:MAG: Uncharacterised protein [Halieaceae bacterium]|nr:MAG: Uncharacterised protein [Halieaceae bacterium]
MAPRHQQRHEGIFGDRARLVLRQHGRQQVPFHMVHPQAGHTEARGNSPTQRGTHHQCANKPRARGISHALNLTAGNAALRQHLINQRQGFTHVVTAGQLGHHTAVLRVNVDLGVQCVRQQTPLGVIQRHPGLITAGFYAQYLHCALVRVLCALTAMRPM